MIAAGTPAPAPTPVLKQIGRSAGAAAVCGNLVVHANSAIDAALRDDVLVGRVVTRLHEIDLENNAVSKRAGLSDLNRLVVELSGESLRGESEVKRLREAAERNGASLSSDLRTFADALAGALGRQHKIGIDLNNFLAYIDYRDMREVSQQPPPPQRRGTGNDPFGTGPFPFTAPTPTAPPGSPYAGAGSPNRMALAAANDFESRVAEIQSDEAKAAGHSEAAVSGCS